MNRAEWAFIAKLYRAEHIRHHLGELDRELAREAADIGRARGSYGLRPEALRRELVG